MQLVVCCLCDQQHGTAGDTRGVDATADPKSTPVSRHIDAAFPAIGLVGSLTIFAAAGLLAWHLKSSRQKYEPLGQSDLTEEISSRHRSQRLSTDP